MHNFSEPDTDIKEQESSTEFGSEFSKLNFKKLWNNQASWPNQTSYNKLNII